MGLTRKITLAGIWRAFLICVWFGILAGLAERIIYSFHPGLGVSDLWYCALLDVFLFAALALPVILFSCIVPLRPTVVAALFGGMLLSLDCFSLLVPPYHKMYALTTGASVGAGLAFLARRWEGPCLRFVRLSLLPGAAYILVLLGVVPALHAWQERQAIAGAHAASTEPNVLVIVVDALRADHLSAYAYPRKTSPHLDLLAAEGILFENAIASSSWTTPSHATMLTGRLPSEHGAGEYALSLSPRFKTLGEAFERAGYRTAAFSGNPNAFTRRLGFGRGFMHFEDGSLEEHLLRTNFGKHFMNEVGFFGLETDIFGRQNAAEVNENAFQWIDRNQKPFFVFINDFDVHEPFMPPLDDMRRFSAHGPPLDQMRWPDDVQLPPAKLADEIDAYDAAIAYDDEQIGQFLEKLRVRGILKNTIVVITSDHGQGLNEHGALFHGRDLYWSLIHAPLIIYAPGRVPSGGHIHTPIALQSLPSTLLELAGIKNGVFPYPSLVSLWSGNGPHSDWPYPVSELAQVGESPLFPSYYGPLRSLVTPEWHYIEGGKLGQELYHCCGNETQNLALAPAGDRIATNFRRALDEGRTVTAETLAAESTSSSAGDFKAHAVGPGKLSNERARQKMNEQLRALGYVP